MFVYRFSEDLDKLANIPILAALTSNAAKPFHGFDELYKDNDLLAKQSKSNESNSSLKDSGSSGGSKKKEAKAGGSVMKI